MNQTVSKFLLAGDEFMHEMHIRQPVFIYSACGSFIKNKGRIQKFKGAGDSRYIYQNELDKVYFKYKIAYVDFKDLTRKTASDKILRDKVVNIAKNPKYNGYQRRISKMDIKCLGSIVYKCFDKKASGTCANKFAGSGIKNQIKNYQKNYINHLLKHSRKEKYSHLL